jgi:hypothetical protein
MARIGLASKSKALAAAEPSRQAVSACAAEPGARQAAVARLAECLKL